MKAVIIGANSYIARNMIAINLHKKYAEVTLYDYEDMQKDGDPNYHKINMDSANEIARAIENVDLIYFFIGKTGTIQGLYDSKLYLQINETYLLSLLNTYCEIKSKAKIHWMKTRNMNF